MLRKLSTISLGVHQISGAMNSSTNTQNVREAVRVLLRVRVPKGQNIISTQVKDALSAGVILVYYSFHK